MFALTSTTNRHLTKILSAHPPVNPFRHPSIINQGMRAYKSVTEEMGEQRKFEELEEKVGIRFEKVQEQLQQLQVKVKEVNELKQENSHIHNRIRNIEKENSHIRNRTRNIESELIDLNAKVFTLESETINIHKNFLELQQNLRSAKWHIMILSSLALIALVSSVSNDVKKGTNEAKVVA